MYLDNVFRLKRTLKKVVISHCSNDRDALPELNYLYCLNSRGDPGTLQASETIADDLQILERPARCERWPLSCGPRLCCRRVVDCLVN